MADLNDKDDYGKSRPEQQQFFIGERDYAFIQGFNEEYIEDIVNIGVTYYKVAPGETATNLYGEGTEGKVYYPPFQIKVLLDPQDQQTDRQDTAGPTKKQNMEFSIQREMLKKYDIYPEEGDLIQWSNLFYEIKSITDNKILGTNYHLRHGVTVQAVQTRLSQINIVDPDNQ